MNANTNTNTTMTMTIALDALVTEGLQTRGKISRAVVGDYAQLIAEGTCLPPLTVVRDADGTLYLADGFHRLAALRQLGRTTGAADVTDGTFADALRLALSANATHGARRTNADKRHALAVAWQNRETLFGHDPSKRELAAICAVSDELARLFIQKNGVAILATPSESAPAQPADRAPTDRFGASVPEHLRPALDTRKMRTLVRTIRHVAEEIEAAQAASDYAFVRVSQSTLLAIRGAASELKTETPYCVCRACQGHGCRACHQSGVQTKNEYDLNAEELRA